MTYAHCMLLLQAHVTEVEEQCVLELSRSGWPVASGSSVDQFEVEMTERCGFAGALALS